MKSVRLLSAAVAVSAAVTACSGGLHSDSPATQVYVLRAVAHTQPAPTSATASATALAAPLAAASMHINRPIAAPGLDSDHIVLVQSDHRMSYYVSSRWPADLPSLVESLTVDALRANGAWSTVQDSGSIFSSDYMLQIVIRRFEADYTSNSGAPEVRVLLDCTVGKRSGREVISSFIAEGSATAAANRLGDVVSAFEAAANQALADIATRAAQAVQTAQKVETPVPSITR